MSWPPSGFQTRPQGYPAGRVSPSAQAAGFSNLPRTRLRPNGSLGDNSPTTGDLHRREIIDEVPPPVVTLLEDRDGCGTDNLNAPNARRIDVACLCGADVIDIGRDRGSDVELSNSAEHLSRVVEQRRQQQRVARSRGFHLVFNRGTNREPGISHHGHFHSIHGGRFRAGSD